MRKCKLIQIDNKTKYIGEQDEINYSIITNQTDWNEISDEDYDSLHRYCCDKHDLRLITYVEGTEFETILSTAIDKVKREQAANEISRKRYEEDEAKRKKLREKKKEERLLKKLQEAGYKVVKEK